MEKLLEKKIQQAKDGRDFWLNIVKKYSVTERDYVLLLPTFDDELNHSVLKYLDGYLKKKSESKAVVLVIDEEWHGRIKAYSDRISDVVIIREEDSRNLISLYSLYEFTNHLIIGSLDEPDGRMGRNMIGIKGLTLDDIIKVTLYDMSE